MKNKSATLANNKWFLFMMCLFFGAYGVHRFFMRRWISGLLMLALAIVGVSTIWMIVDLIRISLGKLESIPPKARKAKKIKVKTRGIYSKEPEVYEGIVLG